jgi:hypothetical protein
MPVKRATSVRWILCLWPGLPQLWLAGAWSGLALAVGFASLLDLLLLTSLLWTEWVEPAFRVAGWTAVAVLWSVSIVTGRRWSQELMTQRARPREEDLFPRALGEYLKGNWYEAEAACKNLLRRVSGDVQARLLLATLLRRTRRWSEAREQLDVLGRLEAAVRWEFEIAGERERLAEAMEQATIEVGQEGLSSGTDEHQKAQVPVAMLPAA